MVSANFTINNQEIGQNYIIAEEGDTVTLQLSDLSGVTKIQWNFIGYFPSDVILPSIVNSGSPLGSSATFVYPAESITHTTEGSTLLVQCTVNNGRNENGTKNSNYVALGAVGARNAAGFVPFALGETSQFGSHSVIDRLNKILKYASHTSTIVSGYLGDIGFVNSDGYIITDSNLNWNNSILTVNGSIDSTYLTTTAREATFNFGNNDVVIGDGYIKASGAALATYIGSSSKLTLNATQFYPTTDTDLSLGTSTKYWSNLFSQSFNVYNRTVNTNTSAGIFSDDGYFSFLYLGTTTNTNNNAIYSYNSSVAGSSYLRFITDDNSKMVLYTDTLRPYTDNLLDLGTSGYRWNNIYAVSLNLESAISGATTISSSYFTTTQREATFNFGSNDIVIGDGYVKASGASLATYIGGLSKLTLNATEFYPTTDSNISLGITANRWSNFFSDDATIAIANINTLTINTVIIPDTDGGANIGTAINRISQVYAQQLNLSNNTGNCYLQIQSSDTGAAVINFGDGYDSNIGQIYYNNAVDSFYFTVNNASELILTSSELYPTTNNGLNLGKSSYRWDVIYGTSLNLNGAISGATTIGSSYLTTTPNDVTFNFGSNDIIIGDGYIKASGASLATYIGTSSKLILNATQLYPTVDSQISLGITGNRWSNFFSDSATITNGNIDTIYTNAINLNGDISGVTTISSSYLTTTPNDVTFNFGSNDIIIGDGYIKASGSSLATYIGASSKLTLNATQFYPTVDSQISLGTTGNRWSNFFSDSATITNGNIDTIYTNLINLNGAISGATTISSTYFTTTPNDVTFNFGSNDVVIGDGYIKASGASLQSYIGTSSKLTLTATQFYPTTDSQISLGITANRWSNFFSDDATISIANINTLTINTSIIPDTDNGATLGAVDNRFNTIYLNTFSVKDVNVNSNTTTYITSDDGYFSLLYLGYTGNTDNNGLQSFNSSTAGESFIRFRVDDASTMVLYDSYLRPYSNNLLDLGKSSYRWDVIYGTSLNLNGAISGATTIGSSYLTTTPNDVTFNFGSNNISIGDGYIKANNSLNIYIGNNSNLELTSTKLYPYNDSEISLGTTTNRWINFFSDAATITTEIVDTLTINSELIIDKTITGTVGDITINKTAGRVILPSGDISISVVNSYVTANSIIICTVAGFDVNTKSVIAVAGTGSFVITANDVPNANTAVNFLIIN